MEERYSFRPVTPQDLALLRHWRGLPHVAEWWGSDDAISDPDLQDGRVARWIVAQGQVPFAYLQDYAVHAWPAHPFDHLPPGARGIDLYISDPSMLGRGHGTGLLRQAMQRIFAAGAPAIGVDPAPSNLRAIAAYQAAGFAVAGAPRDTEWGRILPMVAWNPMAREPHR